MGKLEGEHRAGCLLTYINEELKKERKQESKDRADGRHPVIS